MQYTQYCVNGEPTPRQRYLTLSAMPRPHLSVFELLARRQGANESVRASELSCSHSHDRIVQNTRVASVRAARRKLVKLFRKPKSKFYWYDFTVRGRRYRGSTQETKSVRALQRTSLKLASAMENTDPLPSKPTALPFPACTNFPSSAAIPISWPGSASSASNIPPPGIGPVTYTCSPCAAYCVT